MSKELLIAIVSTELKCAKVHAVSTSSTLGFLCPDETESDRLSDSLSVFVDLFQPLGMK